LIRIVGELSKAVPLSRVELRFPVCKRAISNPPGRNTDKQSVHVPDEMPVTNLETAKIPYDQVEKYIHIIEAGINPSNEAFTGARPAKTGMVNPGVYSFLKLIPTTRKLSMKSNCVSLPVRITATKEQSAG
jgi:hypothetical protein